MIITVVKQFEFNYKLAHMLPSQIDMICFNQACIASQNQLFLYRSDEKLQHAAHDEQCIYIHPSIFNRKYERQTAALREIKANFQAELLETIGQTVERVAHLLRGKLTQKSSQVYDKELNEFRFGNCQNMLNKIKTREQASSEINFINCLFLENAEGMKNHIVNKMKKCEELINNSLKCLDMQLSQQLQKIINDFVFIKQNKNETESPEKYVKIELQETPVPESSKMLEEKSIEKEQAELKEDFEDDKNYDISYEMQHFNDIRRYFKTNKTKPIQKLTKAIKPLNQLQQSSEEENQESDEISIQENNLSKDDVCILRSDIDWIDLLRDPANFKKLIVYYPLAQEDLLKAIKKTAPKEIYINYEIKLSSHFIDNIPAQILRHLEKFQEFWDPNQFYDEVLNKQHFPTDDFRFIKSVHKIHYSYQQLNIIPRISNIWISNYYDLQQLKLSIKTIKSIDTLRIEACKCCNNLSQSVIAEIFKAFKETHSLKTLILKYEVLNTENTRLLKELIQINKKIECVILEIQGQFIPRRILQCFSSLSLKKLSINSERNNDGKIVYMDITPIAKIRSLRKLAMTNMFFTAQEVTNAEIESGQLFNLDERSGSKISKLTKLVFLDLFRCSPIYPTVVEKLKEKVKRKLYHLNLSHTSMNSALISELYSLPRLKELNIDRTNIPLKEFFKEIIKKPLLSVSKLSMFHFNGDDLDKVDRIPGAPSFVKFSAMKDNEIDKISTCFPNLQYLNIAFCRDFTDLPGHKFKKLKYLCSNKEYMTPVKIEKMRYSRGIEVYLYDGVHKPWNIQ